jgi:hypothetical protein
MKIPVSNYRKISSLHNCHDKNEWFIIVFTPQLKWSCPQVVAWWQWNLYNVPFHSIWKFGRRSLIYVLIFTDHTIDFDMFEFEKRENNTLNFEYMEWINSSKVWSWILHGSLDTAVARCESKFSPPWNHSPLAVATVDSAAVFLCEGSDHDRWQWTNIVLLGTSRSLGLPLLS